MGKRERHAQILRLVSGEVISSQEELLSRLKATGISTTQATLSRDIRQLGLVKVTESGKGFRYLPGNSNPVGVVTSVRGVVLSIARAGHLLVIHTPPGFAQSVAATIDGLGWSEVLGTVGGDDTLMVVVADEKKAPGVEKRLRLFLALDK